MTNPIARFKKDPDAVLDYSIDWSRWLAGDSIISSTWVVPHGLTQVTNLFSPITITVWISGGTVGQSYLVVGQVTTAGGRTDERTIQIDVEER